MIFMKLYSSSSSKIFGYLSIQQILFAIFRSTFLVYFLYFVLLIFFPHFFRLLLFKFSLLFKIPGVVIRWFFNFIMVVCEDFFSCLDRPLALYAHDAAPPRMFSFNIDTIIMSKMVVDLKITILN